MVNRNISQCSQRWRRINPQKMRNPWTPEQDKMLQELYNQYGKNWGLISEYIKGKTGKQIRERYINKLDPMIHKQAWTEKEDQIILDSYITKGPKWSFISSKLDGRSENMYSQPTDSEQCTY
ncbi:myb-like DNA-binding domain protein [Ichthyophthirius multifiliis]|uniref:Myb-like DNA-binding domain protein n=1 Tax=Ichthyophthirius multifiliis TaxID=5932 RepID=G0QZA9_ICHMU|nr:myb-like DNA-binding domain protein [Ichthyophthirius multifiliis]EGR29449.1 myb-like DNA-binding domain protein [Ichthyophthirius multifiliis]|eukprot:XP_004030685.1 myb-like DNA-binding domain protein [Ichthyophthirius multifiliis]